MENGKKFLRHIAVKTAIINLVEGKYTQDGDNEAGYILNLSGEKIKRVNIIAIIVHKEIVGSITNLLIDDGAGKIMVRQFEENKSLADVEIGNIVLIVGKVRVYNQEKYISPEIIKKTNHQWLKVRSLELKKLDITNEEFSVEKDNNNDNKEEKKTENKEHYESIKNDKSSEEEKTINNEDSILLPIEKVINIIKLMEKL